MRSNPARKSPSQSTSPSGSMFSSVPWSSVIFGYVARSFSIRAPLREDLLLGHALHVQVRSVVGDREVRVPELGRAADHLLQAREAVGQVRMGVQVALQLPLVTTTGSSPASAASTSPRSSRRVGSMYCIPRRLVDAPPRISAASRSPDFASNSPYSLSFSPRADGHLPDPDVVRLGAGEVDHRRAPRLLRDDAEVDLQAELGHDRRSSCRLSRGRGRPTGGPRTPPSRAGRRIRPRGDRHRRSSPSSAGASRRRPTRRASGRAPRSSRKVSATPSATSILTRPPAACICRIPRAMFSCVFAPNRGSAATRSCSIAATSSSTEPTPSSW